MSALPCADDDHDWQMRSDWYGDPEVINGTCTFYFMRCRACGDERECTQEEMNQPMGDDYDD